MEDILGLYATSTPSGVADNNRLEYGIKGNHTQTELNELFFSQMNVDALQRGLRIMVADATNGRDIIGRQSEQELLIIMRATYNMYARHMSTNIVEQVRELNKRVLDYAVNNVLVEIEQYRGYIRDASQLYTPMDLPQNLSNKGSKTLMRKSPFAAN